MQNTQTSEDLNISSLMQSSPYSDTTVLSMFPVDELSGQNNTDFSFLNDSFVVNHQHTQIKNMEDNSTESTSIIENQTLSLDWFSGNVTVNSNYTLDDDFSVPDLSEAFYPTDFAGASNSISADLSKIFTGQYGISSTMNECSSSTGSEERICSSADESTKEQTMHQVKSFSVPGSDELFEYNADEVTFSIAGKKYFQMRKKNNLASQRSRKLRKQKNLEMTEKLKNLEIENKELTLLAAELEKERDDLKKKLFEIISKK